MKTAVAIAARLARLRWHRLGAAIGLAIGLALGSLNLGPETVTPGAGMIPLSLLNTALTVGVIGGGSLLGVLLLMGDATAGAGKRLLVVMAFTIVGWLVGNALLPR